MPFALKNPYANALDKGEKRAGGEALDDPSTLKKAKKAPSAASLVRSVGFCTRLKSNVGLTFDTGGDGKHC